ncbi:PIN domain-containing protein, partial [Candidatus Micrarchaeota archaeon]|nr:PIN domain-containing protein [Candidatus Micrarchaeota archaeon]
MNFVDSSIFIASYRLEDEFHRKGLELLKKAGTERIVITDHILDEVVTFISKRVDKNKAYEIGLDIMSAEEVEIVYCSEEMVRESLELVKRYEKLSLCDALSIV